MVDFPKIPGAKPPKYGFQKSENTRAVATIYQHGDDPIMLYAKKKGDAFTLKGNRGDSTDPSILSVMVQKSINNAAGTFTIVLKPSKVAADIFKTITDDDWVDITYYINNKPYHIFRGLIDAINRKKSIGGSGATTTVYNISGRCFGKIWEATPIWFSPYYNDIVTEAASRRVFDGVPEFLGSPDKAALSFLKKFLEELELAQGPNWKPPASMPGLTGPNFINNVNFNDSSDGTSKYFQNIPRRIEFNLNAITPEGTLWDLAKEFSDPLFTEMYTDYLPNGDPFSKHFDNPIETGAGNMAVVVRDRPFPFLDTSVPVGYEDTWDTLPIFSVYPQEIRDSDVSKSGYERYNAFYVASRIHQEEINQYALNLISPLMDKDAIKRHGFRRFDVQSSVHPSDDNLAIMGGTNVDEMCRYQRQLIRDWYCLNPYMISGTIVLGHGRPDIHIGCRLHVPGVKVGNKEFIPEENYYIEEVSHNWIFGQGVRTTLGVTRGWLGDLSTYYDNLNRMVTRYSTAELLEPILEP